MIHSDFQPTGRFAKKGTVLNVILSSSNTALEIVFGQYWEHANLNEGQEIDPISITLNHEVNRVIAPIDGMVYIQNKSATVEACVEIQGGQPVPTYIKGVTVRADFDEQLTRWSASPFIELIGDYVLANFQYAMAVQALTATPVNLDRRIAMMDEVVAHTHVFFGLSKNAIDVAYKSSHRLYIANPDTGPGYASASNYHITFQNDTGAGKHLLVGPENDQWGFYHEVGHTYQMDEMNLGGLGEITNNVSSVYVQEIMGYPNYLDEASTKTNVMKFRETPIAERNFGGITNGRLKVFMFDQLRRGFGSNFYGRLTQKARLDNAMGLPEPVGNLAHEQYFMVTAAQVTQRNLTPFFEEWGLPIESATRTELEKFPALEQLIWNNFDRSTDVMELNLVPLNVPSTLTAPAEGVYFDVNHVPVYYGRGTPGATITLEQGLRTAGWSTLGTTTVNDSGEWSFSGHKLPLGEYEARATQSNGGSGSARNRFTVVEEVEIPVTLTNPATGALFDVNHVPVYSGLGTPGATIIVEQGLRTGDWSKVGEALVDTNGEWLLVGQKLPAGEREARATQNTGAPGFAKNTFTVEGVVESPVTLISPAQDAFFDEHYEPIYSGRGTPDATITVEQGLLEGDWSKVGEVRVNAKGDWSCIGQKLSAGNREARATQSSDGSVSERNVFKVVEFAELPLTLISPANGSTFDEYHQPVYSGRGTPGDLITIEQGLRTSGWSIVATVIVNTNGDWSYIGPRLSAGEREARAKRNRDGALSEYHDFTVKNVLMPVSLLTPTEGHLFESYDVPVYSGRGAAGALIIIEQGLRTGDWSAVGMTKVNDCGDWSFTGNRLAAGEREARATQYLQGVASSDRTSFLVFPREVASLPTPPSNLSYEWTSLTTGRIRWDASNGDSNGGPISYRISQRSDIWHSTDERFYDFTWILPFGFTARLYAIQLGPDGIKRSEKVELDVFRTQ